MDLHDHSTGYERLKSLYDKCHILSASERENFLYQYYLNCFYYDKNLAREIALEYLHQVNIDTNFKNHFLNHETFINNNFKFVNVFILCLS
jgi:hypothetical protein